MRTTARVGAVLLGFLLASACTTQGAATIPSPVDTSAFDGEYELVDDENFLGFADRVATESDPVRRENLEKLFGLMKQQYGRMTIRHGVIHIGSVLVQEFSLKSAETEGDALRGRAVWHEDMHDPGDMSEVTVLLRLSGDRLEFSFAVEPAEAGAPFVYRRAG